MVFVIRCGNTAYCRSFLYFRLKHKLIKEVDRVLLDESVEILQESSGDEYIQNDIKITIEKMSSDKKFHKISVRLLDVEENKFITSKDFLIRMRRYMKNRLQKQKKEERVHLRLYDLKV